MSGNRLTRALFLVGLCLALTACGHSQSRDDSSLGLDAERSPGDLYVAMAAEYYRLGQMDSALRNAQRGIDEDKNNPRAYYMIAVIYQKLGETSMADESFKRAVELSPKNSDIRNAYGTFFCSQRRYAEAQQQFAKALENPLYGTPWVAMTNAGTCAASAGNPTQAESDYRRALNASPRFGPALLKMAEIEYRRANPKGAKTYLDTFFQANPPTPQALSLGIKIERTLGNSKGAATYEQLLRNAFPGSSGTMDL
jgi:type IV pilus assembly protein PilF